jgi:hypothetical protein
MDHTEGGRVARFLRRERTKAGVGFGTFAISVLISVITSIHPLSALIIILLAIGWNVFLFWPEIRSLRIVYPERARTESPIWLYIFSLAALAAVVVMSIRTYELLTNGPRTLTSDEFAQSYISGKHFRIADLVDSNNVIEGRTIEDCWLYGPAVIMGVNEVSLTHLRLSKHHPINS